MISGAPPCKFPGELLGGIFSTRGFSLLWLMRKRLHIFTNSWFNMLVTLSIPSFNMSRLMGAISIEQSKTRVDASSSDIPFAEHVAIYWTPASVLRVWCFNGDINSSHCFWTCTSSSLTSEFQMEIPFDSFSIADLWEMIGSSSKYLGFVVIEPKKSLYLVVLTLHWWTLHIPMFNYVSSGSVTPM